MYWFRTLLQQKLYIIASIGGMVELIRETGRKLGRQKYGKSKPVAN